METQLQVVNWLVQHGPTIVAVLFGISESLALLPIVKANSVFQLVFNGLKRLAGK